MARIRWRSFLKGLWMMGAREQNPRDTLRRAVGIAAAKTGPITSRWGSSLVTNMFAHSLYRFQNRQYAGVGTVLYQLSTTFGGQAVPLALMNGERLSFVRMPPTAGKTDWLYIAGGGNPVKSGGDPIALAIHTWGIPAPTDSFTTASVLYANSRLIDTMDSAASWTGVSATLADEGTIKQQGANSMKMTVAASTIGTATKAISVDLSTFPDTTVSADQDLITGWVRVDNPGNLVQLQIDFDINAGDFTKDYYTRIIPISDVPAAQGVTTQTIGVGSPGTHFVTPPPVDIPSFGEGPVFISTIVFPPVEVANDVSTAVISTATGQWLYLRILKQAFQRVGSTAGKSWATVAAVRLTAQTNANGQVIVYWDIFGLSGSVGLLGDYKYHVTFLAEATGVRSNPNPTPIAVSNVQRQPVILTNLPIPNDLLQHVTAREIWRTVGGGSQFFFLGTTSFVSDSYIDRVSDFVGFNGPQDSSSLQNVLLPFDNNPPLSTFENAFGPLNATMYWTRDTEPGNRGRVYFSPVGRPDSVLGFVDASTDDDPMQCGVVWNARVFGFSESKIVEIVGDGDARVSQDVYGAPGTISPFSVVATPYGIAYLATDGVRLFNGVFSRLVFPEAVELLFKGEPAENVPPFFTSVLCYAAFRNDEYIISDTATSYAVNLATGTWRIIGLPLQALYTEPDTTGLLASTSTRTFMLEDARVPLDFQLGAGTGSPVAFEVQTPSAMLDDIDVGVLQRLYIDVDPNGNTVTPTLLCHTVTLDGTVSVDEVVLPTFTGAGRRTVEYAINRSVQLVGVRLNATLSVQTVTGLPPITVYGIEADIYAPKDTGRPTP